MTLGAPASVNLASGDEQAELFSLGPALCSAQPGLDYWDCPFPVGQKELGFPSQRDMSSSLLVLCVAYFFGVSIVN